MNSLSPSTMQRYNALTEYANFLTYFKHFPSVSRQRRNRTSRMQSTLVVYVWVFLHLTDHFNVYLYPPTAVIGNLAKRTVGKVDDVVSKTTPIGYLYSYGLAVVYIGHL